MSNSSHSLRPNKGLKPRDIEALRLAALGKTNEEIADHFSLSLQTVDRWFGIWDPDQSISYKIGARNKKESIAWYVAHFGPPEQEPKAPSLADLGEQIRTSVQAWMETNQISTAQLGEEIDESQGAVTAFLQGGSSLNWMDRRTFLKVLGVLSIKLVSDHDLSLINELVRLHRRSMSSYELGTRLLAYGADVALHSWERAISLFREAEYLLGPASSQAAMSALEVARMQVYLGDYNATQHEIARVQNEYGDVMDPETQAKAFLLSGWVAYYRGLFSSAQRSFNDYLHIAKETGIEFLGVSTGGSLASHFLARIAYDAGRLSSEKQESARLFRQAEQLFDESYRITKRRGIPSQIAFELLRKSQLLRTMGNWREARKLRDRAGQMFSGTTDYEHVRLEEATIAYKDGQVRVPKHRAETVLRTRAEMRYPKGMADAMKLLGKTALLEGHQKEAMEYYTAALCIYPYEQHLSNRLLWAEIEQIITNTFTYHDVQAYRRLLLDLEESAMTRRGPFVYLDSVSTDLDENKILRRLSAIHPKEAPKNKGNHPGD